MEKVDINIAKIANMAKIELYEEEEREFTEDIIKLKELVKVLEELPASDAMDEKEAVLRRDEIAFLENREILMKNAPERIDGFFAVPNLGGENE